MTTLLLSAPTAEDRTTTPLLRLSLAPLDTAPALLDGAWWPHSRDLASELPLLTTVLDPLWGRITRVAVNPTHWPVLPRKVPVTGHVVGVGWFKAEQDPHKLLLLSYNIGRWDLLVIPPQTPPATAAWLMAAAVDPLRTDTAGQLMQEAALLYPSADADQAQQAVWDAEGGRVPRPAAPLLPGARGPVTAPDSTKGR
ncbi:DUF5994 family protein [Streptomyces smyrnaeus]|uniref:DUF5994 family protein n=1 Tax=Streptomyces smyrnaeus TaxID=1387713 RepID=UPI0036A38548